MKKLLIALMMLLSSSAFAVTELTPKSTEAELTAGLNTGKPVVIEFYADWCHFCQDMKPMYEQAEADMKDKATFYRINVDSKNPLARQVDGLPTIVVLKARGEAAKPLVGAQPSQEELEKQLLERMK